MAKENGLLFYYLVNPSGYINKFQVFPTGIIRDMSGLVLVDGDEPDDIYNAVDHRRFLNFWEAWGFSQREIQGLDDEALESSTTTHQTS